MKLFQKIGIAAFALASAVAVSNASATTILVFGQTVPAGAASAPNEFTADETAGTTVLDATNIAITITTIENSALDYAAYFNLDATSTGPATSIAGVFFQAFSGSFTITSGINGTGTNYLSGSFQNLVFGAGSSFSLNAASDVVGQSVTFNVGAGSPITSLDIPRAISLSFTNVTPSQSVLCNNSICDFSSNVAGTFSADAAKVPEPGSLALLGLGLAGLGLARRRRQ